MAEHGVFGEIIRDRVLYIHNLDDFWIIIGRTPMVQIPNNSAGV